MPLQVDCLLCAAIAMHMKFDWVLFAGGANKASGGVGEGTGAARGASATGAAAQVTP